MVTGTSGLYHKTQKLELPLPIPTDKSKEYNRKTTPKNVTIVISPIFD